MKENIQNGLNPMEGNNPIVENGFNPDWIESVLIFDPLRKANCAEIEFNKEKKYFILKSNDWEGEVVNFVIKPLSDDLVLVKNMKTKEVKAIVLTYIKNQHPDEDFVEFLNQGGVYTSSF